MQSIRNKLHLLNGPLLLKLVTWISYKSLNRVSTLKLLQIKMRTQAIVIAALLGFALAAEPTLKQKLGQTKKNLAQVQQDCPEIEASAEALPAFEVAEPTLEWCDCAADIEGGLGAGVQASNNLQAQVLQSTQVSSTPDVSQSSECVTNCCACNEAQGEERVNAQRVRHFCIAGDISVTEDIEFHALSRAQEASAGRAHKDSECVLNNQGSEELGGICIEDLEGCPDEGLSGGRPGSSISA